MIHQLGTKNLDATCLSPSQVVDLFRAELEISKVECVATFLATHPEIDPKLYLVSLVIADIQWHRDHQKLIHPKSYFERFGQLNEMPDAWKILEATEECLIRSDGSCWTQAWSKRYPDAVACFVDSKLTAAPHDQDEHLQPNPTIPNLNDLQPGDQVLDFEIIRFIGAGTFGRVYQATDLTLDRLCALKIAGDRGSEGQVLAKLDHPAITHVYREHSFDGKKLLAMQFVDGMSLADWIASVNLAGPKNEAVKSVKEGVRLICDIAAALNHAHLRGVLHRDIKPANILIDQSGQPFLSDFNIAVSQDVDESFHVGGTINYMSPEQLQAVCFDDTVALRLIDTRSDIYSLGVVLLEVITGCKTWGVAGEEGQQASELTATRIRTAPTDTEQFPGVTPALAAIVRKALDPKPEARYQTAADFEIDLRCWLQDRNSRHADNPNLWEALRRHVRQFHRRWIGALAAISCLVVFLAVVWFGGQWQAEECELKLQQVHSAIHERRLSQAAVMLGEARTQIRQAVYTQWGQPFRFARLERVLRDKSAELSCLEAESFSSSFGEVILREVHQTHSQDSAALIRRTLDVYGVLSFPDWTQRAPFTELSKEQQSVVSECVTELILVSVYVSSREVRPNREQIQASMERLPSRYQRYSIFHSLKQNHPLKAQDYRGATEHRDPFELYLWGVLASLEEQHDSAAEFYRASLAGADRERFWTHYRLAFTCQKLNRYSEAFIHYGICIGLQPEFAWPMFNLGLVCFELGRFEMSESLITRAIQLDPHFTAAYVALTAVQIKLEKHQAACEVYLRAQRRGIDSPELRANYEFCRHASR